MFAPMGEAKWIEAVRAHKHADDVTAGRRASASNGALIALKTGRWVEVA